MTILLSIESKSTHPIAKAIMEYPIKNELPEATDIKEIAGKGLKGIVNNSKVIVGNKKLMSHFNISTPQELDSIVESIVLVGIDNQFAGYVTIADEMKEDAKETIASFKKEGIDLIMMLSGDSVVSIFFDEKGKSISSQQLADQLQTWNDEQQHVSIIIGGADGLSDELKEKSNQMWSLSKMTLPHGLVRVMLAEQLYRAWTITQNHPYHRE